MAGGVGLHTCVAAEVNIAAQDWAAAITAAAQLLVTCGAAEDRYTDRCVQIVREQGPYIVIARGVALAHARPEDGALGLGLTVVRLARPVPFGSAANDPVDLVFAFSSPDARAHVGLLGALARRLLTGLADELRTAPTDESASELLQEVVEDAHTDLGTGGEVR